MLNKKFGRLLKAGVGAVADMEDKKRVDVEAEFAGKLCLTEHSLQRYKRGFIPPEDRTIELLAEWCVVRGYMNPKWLNEFLTSSGFPKKNQLIQRLYPQPSANPHRKPVLENLPSSNYGKFVERDLEIAKIVSAIDTRASIVLLFGMGGNGKTSLAYEVAYRYINGQNQGSFDAVVWVSDKGQSGSVNFSTLLYTIATTLDYPGIIDSSHSEKCLQIQRLLKSYRTLLVIDNCDTITDEALFEWLATKVPEQSKVILTSRTHIPLLKDIAHVVKINGMSKAQALEFIERHIQQLDLDENAHEFQYAPFIDATHGNPTAMRLALGLMKYQQQPLSQVVQYLVEGKGDLFQMLFGAGWASMPLTAQRILMACSIFHQDTTANALGFVAGVDDQAFSESINILIDMALLDVLRNGINSPVRYALHPLVRSYALSKLEEQSQFQDEVRNRWARWHIELVKKVGFCWDDLQKLKSLDPVEEELCAVLIWLGETDRHSEVLEIANGFSYYQYVRGTWRKAPIVSLERIRSARALSNIAQEALGTAHYIDQIARQERLETANLYVTRLLEFITLPALDANVIGQCVNALANYFISVGDLEAAGKYLRIGLEQNPPVPTDSIVARNYAYVLSLQGKVTEAKDLYKSILAEALKSNVWRTITRCQLELARIALETGEMESARQLLRDTKDLASQWHDRFHLAEIQFLTARLCIIESRHYESYIALKEAIGMYERLGIDSRLAQATAMLKEVDTTLMQSAQP